MLEQAEAGIRTDEFAVDSEQNRSLLKKIVTTIGLGALAFGSYRAERLGIMDHWNNLFYDTGTSVAHPLLGYGGTWFGLNVVERIFNRFRPDKQFNLGKAVVTSLTAATVADLGVEETQDLLNQGSTIVRHLPPYFWERASWFESSKDFAFALGGAILYLIQNRSELRRD